MDGGGATFITGSGAAGGGTFGATTGWRVSGGAAFGITIVFAARDAMAIGSLPCRPTDARDRMCRQR